MLNFLSLKRALLLRAVSRIALCFVFISSNVLVPLDTMAYEAPVPGEGEPAIDYIALVMDANPGLSPRNQKILIQEIVDLYGKYSNDSLTEAEKQRLKELLLACNAKICIDIINFIFADEIRTLKEADATRLSSQDRFRSAYRDIQKLKKEDEWPRERMNLALGVFGLLPGVGTTGGALALVTGFATNSFLDTKHAVFDQLLDDISRDIDEEAFDQTNTAMMGEGYSPEGLRLCQAEDYACVSQKTHLTEAELNEIDTYSGDSSRIEKGISKANQEYLRSGDPIKADPKTKQEIQDMAKASREFEEGIEKVANSQVNAANQLAKSAKAISKLKKCTDDVKKDQSNVDGNQGCINLLKDAVNLPIDEIQKRASVGYYKNKKGQEVANEFLSEVSRTSDNLIKEYGLWADNVTALPDLAANLNTVGIKIPDKQLKALNDISDHVQGVQQTLQNFAMGNYIGGIASALSIFGKKKKRKNAQAIMHQQIMKRLSAVIDNQKIIMENQATIIEAILDTTEQIIEVARRHQYETLQVLDDLKTVVVANNVALEAEATEGLSRCEAFVSSQHFYTQNSSNTTLENLDEHYNDYFIDYRSCIRDLIKFISYNDINHKFNDWYFIWKLAELDDTGSGVIDTSTREALANSYAFHNSYVDNPIEGSALFSVPTENYREVHKRITRLKTGVDLEIAAEQAIRKHYERNFPRYMAPGLVRRVVEMNLNLYHYWELVEDPDNQSRLNSMEQILNRKRAHRRALDMLKRSHDILEVAIAQQAMISGDIMLERLGFMYEPTFTESEYQATDILEIASIEMAANEKRDAHRVLAGNTVARTNALRVFILEQLKRKKWPKYRYYMAYSETEFDKDLKKILGDNYEFRRWKRGDEEGWEVRYVYTNSANPEYSRDTYVKLPTPEEITHEKLMVTPDLRELVGLQLLLQKEIAEYEADMSFTDPEDRKSLWLTNFASYF